MNIFEQITNLKRINHSIHANYKVVNNDIYSEFKFFSIDKIILSNQVEFNKRSKFINSAVINFLQAISSLNTPLIYMLKSSAINNEVNIYIGVKKSSFNVMRILSSYFQGIEFHEDTIKVEELSNLKSQVLVTGIPISYKETELPENGFIDPMIKYIGNKNITVEIIIKPITVNNVQRNIEYLLREKTQNAENIKKTKVISISNTDTTSSSKGITKTEGSNQTAIVVGSNTSEAEAQTDTISQGSTKSDGENSETIDAYAYKYDELLDLHITRLISALSSGMWQTLISISSDDERSTREACSILTGTYSQQAIEPFKIHPMREKINALDLLLELDNMNHNNIFDHKNSCVSYLMSEELSKIIDLPKNEHYGYEIMDLPKFSQNARRSEDGILIGNVFDGQNITQIDFKLSREDITKHILVAGITGSGKTNTIFNILSSVDVPFLVIEPAKKEYRQLQLLIPNLRVYTLGDENVSPFRFNPFYFGRNINIQQHIDNIKVIFTASFAMYASMPNILEQCLNNIYIKKGWSLTTSENIYEKDGKLLPEYFPTIEDLYYEIDSYLNVLGYAPEQTQNIRAALLTRIKSLMTGGKGFMLNTVQTIDIYELLEYPTILEFDSVADDDEKSLIIGFITMNIYEHLKTTVSNYDGLLKHILVFEEAHRIFKNVSQNQSQETANIKGKAVENLSNILCEVRAYGQGILIVDQVPTKLASDVLKNTNTKIIHRLVSKDDCDYVGNSISLLDNETSYLNKLQNGSAIVFADGMNGPAHVQAKLVKVGLDIICDSNLKEIAKLYNEIIDNHKDMHPLTDLIMQYNPLPQEILDIGNNLYNSLINDDLTYVSSYFNTAKKLLIDYAYKQGFDTSIKREKFVNSMLYEILKYILKTEKLLKNNLNKTILFTRYIESCIDISEKIYIENIKEYKLLELCKKRLV